MTEEGKHQGLGRGLSALLGEDKQDTEILENLRAAKSVPIEHLHPNPNQPRRQFDNDAALALADSIRIHGILQPILVRSIDEDGNSYEIIAGERRWRAAQRAQLHEVPIIVKEINNILAIEMALVENIQREDLTAIEEAEALQRLADEFDYTQEELAKGIGKSRSHVANTLRLLGLPQTVKEMILKRQLTAGHARALLSVDDPVGFAKMVIDKGLSVREVERQGHVSSSRDRRRPRPEKDPDTLALERDISLQLGLDVGISYRSDKGGYIKINYQSLEQLEEVCQRLCQSSGFRDKSDTNFSGS